MRDIGREHFIRRTSAALCAVSLTALLGACTHSSTPNAVSSKSWVIDNVAGKSTSELTADAIAPAAYARSSSKEIDGYTVESGNLLMPDTSVGSLITVRSKDGSLLAVVEKSGQNGLLVINSKGESHFTPSPVQDYSSPDTVVNNTLKPKATPPSEVTGPYIIDMLIGYTRHAVNVIGGNAQAHALAQVESVNLALRNSLVTSVSMRLAGVQIVEQEYPITPGTLNALPQIFAAGMSNYRPDMVYGMLGGHVDDSAVGYGVLRGRFAIGFAPDGPSFRHEVGHNVGGMHCAVQGGAPFPYGYGHQTSLIHTAQCGNSAPYYSTPAVRDANGVPIGNATNADMARAWRENAARLADYETCVDAPTNLRADLPGTYSLRFQWSPALCATPQKYELWRYIGIVPVAKIVETTGTQVVVTVPAGLRSYRVIGVYSDGKKSEPSELITAKPLGPTAETK